jgi:hypothetical protein
MSKRESGDCNDGVKRPTANDNECGVRAPRGSDARSISAARSKALPVVG